MREDLILDEGRVAENKDILNGKSRHFCDQDSTESVGNAGIDADERKGRVVWLVCVEVDFEVLSEAVQIPRVVLFRSVVAGDIVGGGVRDGFGIDAHHATLLELLGGERRPALVGFGSHCVLRVVVIIPKCPPAAVPVSFR